MARREAELAELMKSVKQKEGATYNQLAILILAAGLGKRMKSPDKPKVMFEVLGRPMIEYVAELAIRVNAEKVVAIVGHHKEQVIELLNNKFPQMKIDYAVQDQQLGTGHAVMQAESILKDFQGDVLILSGDVPLLKYETIEKLINAHYDNNNVATLLTTTFNRSDGYGRIVRDEKGNFLKIVEDKDATDDEKKIKEINPAIYVVDVKELFDSLKKLTTQNSQGEYYLTDIFHYIPNERTGTVVTNDEFEVTGVNSIEQLLELEMELKRRKQIEC